LLLPSIALRKPNPMVAKPAMIKQSDVTRILKRAKAAGVEMSIIVTAGEVRFIPVARQRSKLNPMLLRHGRRSASCAEGKSKHEFPQALMPDPFTTAAGAFAMTMQADAAHTALSRFRRALLAAEKVFRSSPALLDQAGTIIGQVKDARLSDLVPDAEDLYRRAMNLGAH
jgi:hypothetical protein